MGIMVYSLSWAIQDLYHQPYFSEVLRLDSKPWTLQCTLSRKGP